MGGVIAPPVTSVCVPPSIVAKLTESGVTDGLREPPKDENARAACSVELPDNSSWPQFVPMVNVREITHGGSVPASFATVSVEAPEVMLTVHPFTLVEKLVGPAYKIPTYPVSGRSEDVSKYWTCALALEGDARNSKRTARSAVSVNVHWVFGDGLVGAPNITAEFRLPLPLIVPVHPLETPVEVCVKFSAETSPSGRALTVVGVGVRPEVNTAATYPASAFAKLIVFAPVVSLVTPVITSTPIKAPVATSVIFWGLFSFIHGQRKFLSHTC